MIFLRELEPRINLIVGPMYSGKSTELLANMDRYEIAGCAVRLFKPARDTRYSRTEVVTHKGHGHEAHVVGASDELCRMCEGIDVVCIDEVQFFDEGILDAMKSLRDRGKVVYGAALNMDFNGDPFRFPESDKHIGDLLAISSPIYLTAVCMYPVNGSVCGRDAEFSKLVAEDTGDHIHVGGKESYIAVCFEHFKDQ